VLSTRAYIQLVEDVPVFCSLVTAVVSPVKVVSVAPNVTLSVPVLIAIVAVPVQAVACR
jgi:hypothetical protein